MSANRKKRVPNFTQVSGRLIVDQYHEICMCPECHTLLDAPGASVPVCPCGTDKIPLGEEIRLTVDVRSANERVIHVFGDGISELLILAVFFSENGKKAEHELSMNASYLTKFYEVHGLDPLDRYTTEWIGTITSFVRDKICNVT